MVSMLDSGARAPGLSPERGRCVAFLGKTLLQVCLKWQVCSLNRMQSCQKQQQGYLFQMNAVIPHRTSQQAHARLVNYTSTSVTLV